MTDIILILKSFENKVTIPTYITQRCTFTRSFIILFRLISYSNLMGIIPIHNIKNFENTVNVHPIYDYCILWNYINRIAWSISKRSVSSSIRGSRKVRVTKYSFNLCYNGSFQTFIPSDLSFGTGR